MKLTTKEERKQMSKEDYKKMMDDYKKRIETTLEDIKKKDYLLTVYQIGCKFMSDGDWEREVRPRRFYVPVSINEIQDYTRYLEESFWTHPNQNNPNFKEDDIPFEEKMWGRYWKVNIEPLSKELEKSYVDGVEKGFFESWRTISKMKKKK